MTIINQGVVGGFMVHDVKSARDDERREKIEIIRDRIQIAGLKYADVANACGHSVSTIKHVLQPSASYESDATIKLIEDAVYKLCVDKFGSLYRELFRLDYFETSSSRIATNIRDLHSVSCSRSHRVVDNLHALARTIINMLFSSNEKVELMSRNISECVEKLRGCKEDGDLYLSRYIDYVTTHADKLVEMVKSGEDSVSIKQEHELFKYYSSPIYAMCRRNIDLYTALYVIKTN
ncbi:hypothetical protein [Pleomorphomonas carboxyditropha]|nr:hypothetical protein [Pleomorphomonas carboxyditropha]